MNIVIRTDASLSIGSGHVMRCLSLADALKSQGASVTFICRIDSGNMCDFIEDRGYLVYRLTNSVFNQEDEAVEIDDKWNQTTIDDIDWLIVDHYQIDFKWERRLRDFTKHIMVIDCLADRIHDCDILLDQDYVKDMDTRYSTKVPRYCKQLLGPRYAILRKEFYIEREKLKEQRAELKKIMVFMGGSDSINETMKVLRGIELLRLSSIDIEVVVGISNPFKTEVENFCNSHKNYCYHVQVSNIASLMASVDLAICAGGSTIWERCFLGLPSITITVAENQIHATEAAAELGVTCYLGYYNNVTEEDIAGEVSNFMNSTDRLVRMRDRALVFMGNTEDQGTDTVIQEMMNIMQ